MPLVTFDLLTPAHLPRLHGWLQQPHVREFWDDGDRTLEQVRAHYFALGQDTEAFCFALDGDLAGYVQAYPVNVGDEYAAWCLETGETWGLDLFIGEECWLGRGLAVPFIRAFLTHLCDKHPELRRVLIDPEVRNERARHVYRKAGFSVLEQVKVEGKAVELMGLDLLPA